MKREKPKESTIATITMVIDFDEVPADCEWEEIKEAAQRYGGVRAAELVIHRTTKKDLV